MSKKIISLGLISTTLMSATTIACNNSSNKNKPSFKSNKNKPSFKSNNSVVYILKKIAGVMPMYYTIISKYPNSYKNNIYKFISHKGENYFEKYIQYFDNKYGKNKKYKNVVLEKKYLWTKTKWENGKWKGLNIIIEFREFFDWARENAEKNIKNLMVILKKITWRI